MVRDSIMEERGGWGRWGGSGWGLLAPQQHRLVAVAPQTAPVLLGLNTSSTYLVVTTAGVIGAFGIPILGGHNRGFLGAFLVVVALGTAELATWLIQGRFSQTANMAH